MWAIVGSSGFESFDEFEVIEELSRETPFGLCSNGFKRISVDGEEVLFLSRSGENQNILPSKINYKANIYALKKYGATSILALSSVRSINENLKPGDMVIPHQYIDRTKENRNSTFCDNNFLAYVNLSKPICEDASNTIKENVANFSFKCHFNKTYVCIEGPQFPTMAEAKFLKNIGADIIGMTAFPEYALAREAGLNYLPCNFIVDFVPWSEESIIEQDFLAIRYENYGKGLSICRFIINHLKKYHSKDLKELSLSSSIGTQINNLTPDQRSYVDIILGIKPKSKSFKTESSENIFHNSQGNIPKKLTDFLSYVNKFKHNYEPNLKTMRKHAASLNYYADKKVAVEIVRDFEIKNHHTEDTKIKVRLYHPNSKERLPIIIYAHGGGFVSGTLDSFDVPCRNFAHFSNCALLSIDYRLAPEFKYPYGLNDIFNSVKWVLENSKILRVNSDKIILMGDSAGANLVAGVVQKSIIENAFKVNAQILLYPSLNLIHPYPSSEKFSHGYLLEAKESKFSSELYIPEDKSYDFEYISPLLTKNLDISKLPKTFIVTAGFDPLLDEGIAYAEKLYNNKVDISHYHFDNMIHGFINFSKLVPNEMKILYERVSSFISKV